MTRKEKELKIILTMIEMYYEQFMYLPDNHYEDFNELQKYVKRKVEHCPLGDKKTTCGKCTIHCYEPRMQEKIKKIMQYSGPRMIYRHPLMALYHLYYSFKK